MSGRREAQKANTRELILKAARQLFGAGSFEGTTIRAIAKQAGVAVGTVFVHFPDKPSLLTTVLYDDLELVVEEAQKTLPYGVHYREQLRHLIRKIYGFYANNPTLSVALLQGVLALEGPELKRAEGQAMAFIATVCGLLLEAQARGELSESANVEWVSIAFFSHYFFCLWAGLKGDNFDVEAQVGQLDRLLDVTFNGIDQGS